jgi:hypothetical protein
LDIDAVDHLFREASIVTLIHINVAMALFFEGLGSREVRCGHGENEWKWGKKEENGGNLKKVENSPF